jgi:hypothetical protein
MYCEPERLQALQRLFDTLCKVLQLQNNQQYVSSPDVTRNVTARLVMTYANMGMSDGDIFLAILEKLGNPNCLSVRVDALARSLSKSGLVSIRV